MTCLFIPMTRRFDQSEIRSIMTNDISDLTESKIKFLLQDCTNLFNKYSTECKRFQVYEEESFYVLPDEFPIGEETVLVIDEQQKIPLRPTLKTFFLNVEYFVKSKSTQNVYLRTKAGYSI